MSLSIGPTPPQPDDLRFSEAVDLAHKDYARLRRAHEAEWSLDLTGAVRWACSCSPGTPRNGAAIESHIVSEVRKARGPVRGPQTKR